MCKAKIVPDDLFAFPPSLAVRRTSVASAGCAGATKVTKTILPHGCYTRTYECREWMDPQERPSAVLPQRPACGAPLSLLSLASPGLAVRGKPVRRGEGSLDLRLYPLHPYPAPSRGRASTSLILGSTEGAKTASTLSSHWGGRGGVARPKGRKTPKREALLC